MQSFNEDLLICHSYSFHCSPPPFSEIAGASLGWWGQQSQGRGGSSNGKAHHLFIGYKTLLPPIWSSLLLVFFSCCFFVFFEICFTSMITRPPFSSKCTRERSERSERSWGLVTVWQSDNVRMCVFVCKPISIPLVHCPLSLCVCVLLIKHTADVPKEHFIHMIIFIYRALLNQRSIL